MRIENNKIILDNIPVSSHTSKYRFKRKTEEFADYLILQADKNIAETDYIEWQISYDTKIDNIYKNLKSKKELDTIMGEGKPTELKEKIIECFQTLPSNLTARQKKKLFLDLLSPILEDQQEPLITKVRNGKNVKIIMSELSDYYRTAYKNNIISRAEVDKLIVFANSTTENLSLCNIGREQKRDDRQILGFSPYWEKYPIFIKNINENFFVEIIKKHMQKAIGYQNMIFLCAKAGSIKDIEGNQIIGKNPKELKNINFVLDKETLTHTMEAFIIASENHRKDIISILETIVSN